MNFFALDVETANADYSSICQIGVVEFQDDQIVKKWSSLVNPETYFDAMNISIHGITDHDVQDAPTFRKIHPELVKMLTGQIVVHHMPFDRVAINRACERSGRPDIDIQWLDSAKIVRRTWAEFSHKGFGLANVAHFLNITFSHHDALEDAYAAGLIVQHACKESGASIDEWMTKITDRLPSSSGLTYSVEVNLDGPLFGEKIVFTGSMSIPRQEATNMAASLGCQVIGSVSKKTTMLVVGIQDSHKLGGYDKSSKHRKTEELIQKGVPIEILTEEDFISICKDHECE